MPNSNKKLNSIERITKTPEAEFETLGKISLKDSVLRLIWRESEISRAEISRRMRLSRSTVTEIIKELLPTGLIEEIGSGESSGGRRPIVLQFKDDAKVILGIDIGATHISIAVTNLRGKLLVWKEEKYAAREDPEGTFRLIDELCAECFETLGIQSGKLLSIGFSVPSPVDPINPDYLTERIIPAWEGSSGINRLREKYNVPVYLDNDANAGALAEHWFGAGKNYENLIYIKIANGIGVGYILDGKLYRGANGFAGEMSHLPIDPNGRLCACGLRGCLTTVVSAPAILRQVSILAPRYPNSALLNGKVEILNIVQAALEKDPLATEIVTECTKYLKAAVISLVNLLNPELILLGGSLSKLGELLVAPIREEMEKVALAEAAVSTRLEVSELGAKGTAIGAATLAIQHAFIDPKILRMNVQHELA